MKLKSLFFLSLIVFSFLSWRFIDERSNAKGLNQSSLEIRIRNIGHLLLYNMGDSSSRVPPINKLGNNVFQIEFESDLSIHPDTLVGIVHKSIQNQHFSESYTVNVLQCSTSEVVYGFEIFENEYYNVIPCLGRNLPKNCYKINLSFQTSSILSLSLVYPIASLLFCLIFGALVFRKRSPTSIRIKSQPSEHHIPIGKIQFLYDRQILKFEAKSVRLTSKEAEVLKLLALSQNEIMSRQQLQKEVWEDEGVFVGRSLDVFISKLRKKLDIDPNVRIVNIHGKGYKLEIN